MRGVLRRPILYITLFMVRIFRKYIVKDFEKLRLFINRLKYFGLDEMKKNSTIFFLRRSRVDLHIALDCKIHI